MSQQRTRELQDSMMRNQRIKGIFAGIVILACIVFVIWAAWPAPEKVLPPKTDTIAQWETAFAKVNSDHAAKVDAVYKLLGKIAVQPSEARDSIIVRGKVSNAGELNTLKAELGAVQPTVPLVWEVTVGGP